MNRMAGLRSARGSSLRVSPAGLLGALLAAVLSACVVVPPSPPPTGSPFDSAGASADLSPSASLSISSSTASPGLSTSPSPSRSESASPPPSRAGLPDPSLTPGVLNPAVTPGTISTTICKSGWTATIRPPASYTNKLKIQGIAAYGYADTDPRDYEEDHLISLELGGAPRDPRNLWPEPHIATAPDGTSVGSGAKDRLENVLRRCVCARTMTLATARHGIATDWVTFWIDLGRP